MKGSCLCGSVVYEIDAPIEKVAHCHCQTCRKAQGTVLVPTAGVSRESFRWVSGEEKLSAFESSPGKKRYFCSVCGSHLVAMREGQSNVILRVATLDDQPAPSAFAHIWTSHDLPWMEYGDDLPKYPEFVPVD